MKTVLINCSPKSRFSASAYLLFLQRIFIGGYTVVEKIRSKSDYSRAMHELEDADSVVFCFPLYVDSLPSHMLPFLKEMELLCKERGCSLNVYSIVNNGFIEGTQCSPALKVMQNFSDRSGLNWCGGIGVGGGVMLNVTRILFAINAAVFLFSVLACGMQVRANSLTSFLINMALLLTLNMGVLIRVAQMGRHVAGGKLYGERYTRILLPSFVFIIIADVFFAVTSVFSGGLFRGWLA